MRSMERAVPRQLPDTPPHDSLLRHEHEARFMRVATRIPPEWTVREGRDHYLSENGFSVEQYGERWFSLPFHRWTLKLPNPRQRQLNVCRHDLHHVVTGYGTNGIGEIEISAWEVGAGLGKLWIAWVICVPAFLWGLIRFPRRTLAAYRIGRRCRSLWVGPVAYEEILRMTVGELRCHIGLPEGGIADRPARLNRRAPVPGAAS